jgi:tRNA U34 5-methylaminomethyl-2-thiouridine-forming methyltransferase MnmC
MPYSKPFGKIYLQFYSSIKSVIYDFDLKKGLFYDPNLSVLVRVGELFR